MPNELVSGMGDLTADVALQFWSEIDLVLISFVFDEFHLFVAREFSCGDESDSGH